MRSIAALTFAATVLLCTVLLAGCPMPVLRAGFTAVPVDGAAPLNVVFTNTTVSDDPVVEWFWNFGDGATLLTTNQAETSPEHRYENPGVYNVTLRVATATGTSEAMLQVIVRSNVGGEGEGEGMMTMEGEGEGMMTTEGEGMPMEGEGMMTMEGEGDFVVGCAPIDTTDESTCNDGGMTVTRQIVGGSFSPGQPVTVQLTIDYNGTEPVTALAGRERLPENWSLALNEFNTPDITTNPPLPAVTAPPVPNDMSPITGTFEYFWTMTPGFPLEVTYVANVPPTATGPVQIDGLILYRTCAEQQCTGLLETPVNSAK